MFEILDFSSGFYFTLSIYLDKRYKNFIIESNILGFG